MNEYHEVWSPTKSGIIIPTGRTAQSSDRRLTNLVEAKSRAIEIEALYAGAGVAMSPACGLAILIKNARTLSDKLLANKLEGATTIDAFYVLHLLRVADAVLQLAGVSEKAKYLRILATGELDFFKRQKSQAKDILWELELWSMLQERGASAVLKDPPDIILEFCDKSTLGIACKKVYAENNVGKVLSEAVKQVEGLYDAGIAAVNIDLVIPANRVLKCYTEREMSQQLQKNCEDFLKRHERHFRKYLSKGRLAAAFISIHVIAEIGEWNVPFNNCSQSLVWTIPGLIGKKERIIRRFQQLMISDASPIATVP